MNKYVNRVKKALGFDTNLDEHLSYLECRMNVGLATDDEIDEYEKLVKAKRIKAGDGKKYMALATIGAAIVTVLGQVYRVNKITKYEDDDYVVTSRAAGEK